jgi:SAM-dependent methyltransferase
MSTQRDECVKFLEGWFEALPDKHKVVLDIGLAGDPKPGGNYKYFRNDTYETLDCDARYEPTFVFDLQNEICPAGLRRRYDVVILSNTIEHVWDYKQAIKNCYKMLKQDGYLIVDCPWQYPYHAEDDFGDYWRFSHTALQRLLREAGFKTAVSKQGIYCTSALAQHP